MLKKNTSLKKQRIYKQNKNLMNKKQNKEEEQKIKRKEEI